MWARRIEIETAATVMVLSALPQSLNSTPLTGCTLVSGGTLPVLRPRVLSILTYVGRLDRVDLGGLDDGGDPRAEQGQVGQSASATGSSRNQRGRYVNRTTHPCSWLA